jgi:membrane-bound serine protease (ClpP class)
MKGDNMYRRISVTALIALAFCFSPVACSADVVKIVIDDTIHPMVTEHIERAIQEAKNTHAEALLIELRTPGGLVYSTRDIIHDILSSPVPVIVYVAPSGNTAASAGFYILESADIAAMAPGTNTGAAHPVLGDGSKMDPVLKDKMENDAAALMRSYAPERGRNAEVAESAIRQSKSFSADEALSQHLIDYIAKDENDLFRQIDGKTITRFDGSKVVMHVAGKPVRLYEMSLREKILSVLMDPNITAILLAIGMLAIYAEFNHPGAVIPGVIGFIAILLALFALHLLPTRYAALVLILGAFILFALEAKLQTHGVLGIGGAIVMFLGVLLLVDGPIPEMRVKWWTAASISIPLAIITVFLMTIALRARQNKITTGEQGLIGEIAVVSAPLTPAGKVFVHGELWDAVAPVSIEVGKNVVVRGVQNLTLQVEPVAAGEAVSR